MTRRLPLLTLPWLLALAALPCPAQVVGTTGAGAGTVESGGPDVSHLREATVAGPSLDGTLDGYWPGQSLRFQYLGLGTPDFALQGGLFQKTWTIEVSVTQRAYLAGGGLRFAWDPQTGVLDGRVRPLLASYLPYPGSGVGRFDPATVAQASLFLPADGYPGWAQRDYRLAFTTLGTRRGVEVAVSASVRQGTLPRTLITATGFAPALTPLTADLPIGSPRGVVEIPDRFTQRTFAVDLSGFATFGAWRWDGGVSFARFHMGRPVTTWASPFPGPSIREPASFNGTSAGFRLEGRGGGTTVSIEHTYRWGRGEAGERTYEDTSARVRREGGAGRKERWFVEARGLWHTDRASLVPLQPSVIYRGPYYRLLGRRYADTFPYAWPYRQYGASAGLEGGRWSAALLLHRLETPRAYARALTELSVALSVTPLKGLRLEAKPTWSRATGLDPLSDAYLGGGGWAQAADFRPAGARNQSGGSFSARFSRGPFVANATYGVLDAGPQVGLRRRAWSEVFAALAFHPSPWFVQLSGRVFRSDLLLSATTYALPGEPLDPLDPSHRLPMEEEWRRRGGALLVNAKRPISKADTVGARVRWDHEGLSTRQILDLPRAYDYLHAGIYVEHRRGPLAYELEGGVEGYHGQDPLLRFGAVPPGPELWAGLTERPGTRLFIAARMALRF